MFGGGYNMPLEAQLEEIILLCAAWGGSGNVFNNDNDKNKAQQITCFMWYCKTSALCCPMCWPQLAPDLLLPQACGKRRSKCPLCPPPFCWDDKYFRQELALAGFAQHLLESKVSFQLGISSPVVVQIILCNDFILFMVLGFTQRLVVEPLGMSGIVMNLFPQNWFIWLRVVWCNCTGASDNYSKTAHLLPLWKPSQDE